MVQRIDENYSLNAAAKSFSGGSIVARCILSLFKGICSVAVDVKRRSVYFFSSGPIVGRPRLAGKVFFREARIIFFCNAEAGDGEKRGDKIQ